MHKSEIRVLIAEDDRIQNDILKDAISAEPDMSCCGQACDGLKALEMIRTEKPDVLVMDMVMPNMDGVDLLNALGEEDIEKRPKTIVLSAYNQGNTIRKVLDRCADCFLLKPYQLNLLLKRIRLIAGDKNVQQEDRIEFKSQIRRVIARIIIALGVPTNTIGFGYLTRAAELLTGETSSRLICKDIYNTVAEEYNTNVNCVEKAIRRSISEVFRQNTPELHRILKQTHNENITHLSNGRFLTLVAEYVRLNRL